MVALASELAVAATTGELLKSAATMDEAALTAVGADLTGVSSMLVGNPQLRRLLTQETASPETKVGLVQRLYGGKIGAASLALAEFAVSQRWSNGRDLMHGMRRLGRTALFLKAERTHELDDVEEEIFRFGRILDASPELTLVLDDPAVEAHVRAGIVRRLLADKAHPLTVDLLVGLAEDTGGRSYARGVAELVEHAAQRRDKLVAVATAAAPLTDSEVGRLVAALSRIYSRQVVVHVIVDPAMSGGLRVRVGEEVIDGSISGRMATIQAKLAR